MRKLFLYPQTSKALKKDNNDYMLNLKQHLQLHFTVVNRPTKYGVFDLVRKLKMSDIVYFNWIEDLPDKRFGFIQTLVLWLILKTSKISEKKIVWFVHNNLSHTSSNIGLKKLIRDWMIKYSDYIFSHSGELNQANILEMCSVFEHPISEYKPLSCSDPDIDILIWGAIKPYKGILEFVKFNEKNDDLKSYRIVIAGKCDNRSYYEQITSYKTENLVIVNKALDESELESYIQNSSCVLFAYTKNSVLSSGALCKTLSYNKSVIGPNIGSFKELGKRGFVRTYEKFEDVRPLMEQLSKEKNGINDLSLQQYIQTHSWEKFAEFIAKSIL